jgi:hypothetical protein
MAKQNNEESTGGEFVTREELESIFERFLGQDDNDGDDDDGWETIQEDVEEFLGNISPSELEAMMERKVQEAIASLERKRSSRQTARPVTKKVTSRPEPEEAPVVPGRQSFGSRLWGTDK